MIAGLRLVGLTNAAIWFGAAVYFMFVGGPGYFTDELKHLFQGQYAPYLGRAAEIAIHRFFVVNTICGTIALVHLLVEWMYTGKQSRKGALWLVGGILAWTLFAGFILAPHMHKLQTIKYSAAYRVSATAEEQASAAKQFGAWHGISQTVGLFVVVGLFFHFWQIANAPSATRFNSMAKFRS